MRITLFLIAALLLGGCAINPNSKSLQVGDFYANGQKPDSPALSVGIGGDLIATDLQTAELQQAEAVQGHANKQGRPEPTRKQKFICPYIKQSVADFHDCPPAARKIPQQPVFGGNRDPFILQTAPQQPAIGVPSAGAAVEQTFATLYPNHQVIARFPVRNSLRDGTGGLIQAEINQMFRLGFNGNRFQARNTPTNPLAISRATALKALELLKAAQLRERNGQLRNGTLSILKRGNLLRGEDLIFLDNLNVATCRSTNQIDRRGAVIWQCR